MSGIQTRNGKAFEYACILALYNALKDSQTSIIVTCDMGWTVSMRIHNASSRVEPSLKFDVNLISLPNTIHTQIEPW